MDPQVVESESATMREMFAKAARVAPEDTTVLITGETGVGKERLARWLHAHSRRAGGRFVAVNCGALPDTLVDTHLFGHARGAFTGAVADRPGLFEVAAGGTLFLDEIGEVPPATQVRLLRVLQEREVQRVGEWRPRPIDVRILAATNRNLQLEVAEGRFRADLFYRLRVVGLHVPPLRERPGDLRDLAARFLERAAARRERARVGFSREALACLLRYTWPGNVRELENAIEEACACATGPEIQLADLPDMVRQGSLSPTTTTAKTASRPLDDLERAYIDGVLSRYQGHRGRAARELGISVSTLKRRLRRPNP